MERPKIPIMVGGSLENRQSERRALEVTINLSSASNLYIGLTENISEGGIFVASAEWPPLGTRLSLAFTLPGTESLIRCQGEVRWHRSGSPDGTLTQGYGVRFVALGPEAKESLKAFLATREPIFHPDM